MAARKLVIGSILAVLPFALVSCASDSRVGQAGRQIYESDARVQEAFAREMTVSGNRVMAAYHEQEAARARHNEYASDCGIMDWFLSDVLLGSDACQRK